MANFSEQSHTLHIGEKNIKFVKTSLMPLAMIYVNTSLRKRIEDLGKQEVDEFRQEDERNELATDRILAGDTDPRQLTFSQAIIDANRIIALRFLPQMLAELKNKSKERFDFLNHAFSHLVGATKPPEEVNQEFGFDSKAHTVLDFLYAQGRSPFSEQEVEQFMKLVNFTMITSFDEIFSTQRFDELVLQLENSETYDNAKREIGFLLQELHVLTYCLLLFCDTLELQGVLDSEWYSEVIEILKERFAEVFEYGKFIHYDYLIETGTFLSVIFYAINNKFTFNENVIYGPKSSIIKIRKELKTLGRTSGLKPWQDIYSFLIEIEAKLHDAFPDEGNLDGITHNPQVKPMIEAVIDNYIGIIPDYIFARLGFEEGDEEEFEGEQE